MNIFDFENRVRSAANKKQHKLDIDQLVNDLNLGPVKKSPNRAWAYWFSFAAFLGLSTFAYFYFNVFTTESSPQTASILKSTAKEEQISNNKALNSQVINSSNINTETSLAVSTKTILAPREKNKKTNLIASITSNPVEVKNNNITFKADTKTIKPTSTQVRSTKIQLNSIKPKEETVAPASSTSSSISKKTKIDNAKADKIQENKILALLPTKTKQLSYGTPKNLSNKVKDCPTFGNRLWHMALIPEIGYSFPQKSLSLLDENFNELFEDRIENEQTVEGIHASLSIRFQNHETGLYIKPGLSYSRITEQLQHTITDIQRDTTIGVIEVSTNNAGDTMTIVSGEIITETEIISKAKIHYQLHQYDLPIALGYSFDFKGFSIDVEGGLKLNFLQKTSGRLLQMESDFANLDDQSEDLFKNSVGLGFFGGAFIKKQLGSHSELYFGPRFSYNTLSFTTNSNPIRQRYNVLGLYAGAVYSLF